MLGHERYAGADLEVGPRRDDGQRDVRVERSPVALRQVAAAGVGRPGADGDVGVLRQQDRVEPALGGRAGEVGHRQGLVGREVVQGGRGTSSAHGDGTYLNWLTTITNITDHRPMMMPGEPLRYEAINTAVSGPGEHFARYDGLREKGNVHPATVNGRNPFLLVSGIAEIRACLQDAATF